MIASNRYGFTNHDSQGAPKSLTCTQGGIWAAARERVRLRTAASTFLRTSSPWSARRLGRSPVGGVCVRRAAARREREGPAGISLRLGWRLRAPQLAVSATATYRRSEDGVHSLTVSARGIRPRLDWQVGKDSSWCWPETFAGRRSGGRHGRPVQTEIVAWPVPPVERWVSRVITAGDRFDASLPRRAVSASWKSPVDTPRR
jgi:hypothetical protein